MSFKTTLYGKYFLLDRVAVGGMAEVFKAKTYGVRGFERLLVIKRILPHLSKDEEFGYFATGLSEEMQPGSIRELSLSQEIAFRAEFPGARPQPAELYWRALVLTRTDGRRWSRAPERDVSLDPQTEGPALPYTLTLEPSNKPWLPALEVPARIPGGARLRSSCTTCCCRSCRCNYCLII